MACLRDPERGCPWDKEQSFATIAPYTIEEAYEVAEAIARADMTDLRDELGDLLLQVVYHAQIAREAGLFDFEAVADGIARKMVRRHPHVFGHVEVADAAEQSRAWEAHKAKERARRATDDASPASVLDDIASALPALTRAYKLQRRAARVGFDWPAAAPVLAKLHEELAEFEHAIGQPTAVEASTEEMGDLLFSAVNLARHHGIDPEQALAAANRKFERRFRAIEDESAAAGESLAELGLDELERRWRCVKARERGTDADDLPDAR